MTLQRGFDLPHRLRKFGTVPIVTSSGVGATHSEFKVAAPGVVTGRYGTIGQVFFLQEDFWPLNTTLYVRDFHGNDPLFVSYLLRTIDFQTHSGKSGVPGVNRNDLHDIGVVVPVAAAQRRIAAALSDADALIESLEQLLAKKRQIKRGAMQELLTGQRRLPGCGGPWLATTFGEVGSCIRGVTYDPDVDLRDGDHRSTLRLLRSNNVQHSVVHFVDMQYVDERRVSRGQVLCDDDLLVCMANGSRELVGKAARFAGADEHRYTFGAFMARFRPDGAVVVPAFAAYLFQTHRYRTHINLLLAGSSINNLTPSGLKSFNFDMPLDRAEQVAIANTLCDMDAEIAALQARLTKTRLLKQGMAQALLTGRIRLV